MSTSVQLSGQISIGNQVCDPCGSVAQKLQGLQLSCARASFEAVVSTDVAVAVTTSGAVGAAWVDVPTTTVLEAIELLYIRTTQLMRLRIGADVASLVSTGLTLPLGGGETLITQVDGQAAVTTTFTAAATAQQVANEINAACALLGQDPIASVNTSGALVLNGELTGSQGSVVVTGGTGQAALGFAAAANDDAEGEGQDVDVYGLFLAEFGRTAAPGRIQISGSGSVEVLAAGSPA